RRARATTEGLASAARTDRVVWAVAVELRVPLPAQAWRGVVRTRLRPRAAGRHLPSGSCALAVQGAGGAGPLTERGIPASTRARPRFGADRKRAAAPAAAKAASAAVSRRGDRALRAGD